MSNRNKRKGTEWETAVADFLNEGLGQYKDGWKDGDRSLRWVDPRDPDNITRNVQTGSADISDLAMWPFAGEAKNEQTIRLSAYIRQAAGEAAREGREPGLCRPVDRDLPSSAEGHPSPPGPVTEPPSRAGPVTPNTEVG
jgi:hypothetical protein